VSHPHEWIQRLRMSGRTWDEIAALVRNPDAGYAPTAKQLRQAYNRWARRNWEILAQLQREMEMEMQQEMEGINEGLDAGKALRDAIPEECDTCAERRDHFEGGTVQQEWKKTPDGTVHIKYPSQLRDPEAVAAEVLAVTQEAFNDFVQRGWPAAPAPSTDIGQDGDPVCAVLSMNDVHVGMRAWAAETGQPSQDLDTISRDFRNVSRQLIAQSRVYPVEEFVIVVGSDLLHVNGVDGKTKAAVTRNGTAQDFDGRLLRVFERALELTIYSVGHALSTGAKRIYVPIIKGNHDYDIVSFLGVALQQFFNAEPRVEVINSPNPRWFHGYGKNALMIYHGEMNHKPERLMLTFSTECDPEIWAHATHAEILSGHFHARSTKVLPTVAEERGIILRCLPGLTSTDAWHAANQQGYKHSRASTLLMYRRSGGLAALFEAKP